jgi:adenylylsulfate kinase
MLLIQLTGLSGAGKTTLALELYVMLQRSGISCNVFDGDVYRKTLCRDLGFSRVDRIQNIKRLGEAAWSFSGKTMVAIIATINPFEEGRQSLIQKYDAKLVWVDCPLNVLIERDTKGLYKRALLDSGDINKIYNLSGVDDPYEIPIRPDLIVRTYPESVEKSAQAVYEFILSSMKL